MIPCDNVYVCVSWGGGGDMSRGGTPPEGVGAVTTVCLPHAIWIRMQGGLHECIIKGRDGQGGGKAQDGRGR